jgi:hypothetical protein
VLRVLWYSAGKNGQTGLYWSQSNDHGATFTSRQLVATGQTKGSPVLLAENGIMTSVWEGNEDGASKVMTSILQNQATSPDISPVADHGELPAAVLTEGHLFVAYIGKSDGRQNIWLVYAPSM